MSGSIFIARTEAEVALTAATARTVLQVLAATNHRIKLLQWGIYFDGISPTAQPVNIRLLRQTTAGSGGTTNTLKLWDDSIADSLDSTALYAMTSEPTAGDVLDIAIIHPQSFYEVIYTLGREITIGAGDRVGIEVTAPAGVNCWAKMICEE